MSPKGYNFMPDYIFIYDSFQRGHLEPFYSSMYPGLLRYTARLLGDDLALLAEDCLQDSILATYKNRHLISTPEQWRAWMLKSIKNRVIEIMRKATSKRNYSTHTTLSASLETGSVEADLIEQETMNAFFSAIASLPDRYREIVELSFEQGLKNEEVARMLDITEVAVRKRKKRLIEILREKLGGHTDTHLIVTLLANYSTLASLFTPPHLNY